MTKSFVVNYIRDGLIEESHEGIFAENSSKNYDTAPFYLRSCAKPLQATLLIDYDVDLTEKELAICCGSHAGEDCHIETVRNILNKNNLDESLLKCGVHAPLSRTMQDKMLINHQKPTAIHNNCSGKHAGFLAICKKMGWDLKTYDEPSHPLQTAIKNKVNKLCKVKDKFPTTTDGCGVPILSMPLYNIAQGFISLLEYPRIIEAILRNPYIYGGENRTDTEIIQKSEGLIAKVGAGGLCTILNVDKQQAFVLKIHDCSYEARRIAAFEYIKRLGWGNLSYDNNIKTISGKIVGKVKVIFEG